MTLAMCLTKDDTCNVFDEMLERTWFILSIHIPQPNKKQGPFYPFNQTVRWKAFHFKKLPSHLTLSPNQTQPKFAAFNNVDSQNMEK
jgi:hypothetical protein